MGIIFRAALWLGQWVSPSVALQLSALVAWVLDRLNLEPARVTAANLKACFPELNELDRSALMLRSLKHMVLLFFEFAQLSHWPLEKLLSQIREMHGVDWFDEVASQGQGVLVLAPHIGSWEIFCAFLGAKYPFAALYAPPKIKSLEPVILSARKRFKGNMFPIDAGGIRRLLRSLKDGELVVLLPDQVPDREQGVYAPFLGQPALTMTLAHRLANKTEHRVVMISMERVEERGSYHFRLHIEPLVETTAGLDAQGFARVMNQSIERAITRVPEQYQWAYKRFKRPPGRGRNSIYRRQ